MPQARNRGTLEGQRRHWASAAAVQLELVDRERRAKERRIAARFPRSRRGKLRLQGAALDQQGARDRTDALRVHRQAENTLLVGNPGTGKTHLPRRCLAWQARGVWRVTELITTAGSQGREEPAADQKAASRLDLIVLDELGYVPASKAGAELLFDVIARPTRERVDRDDEPALRAMARSAGLRD